MVWLWPMGTLAAESFADKLAVLEGQLKSDPTNTALLFKAGDLCHDEGARDNANAVVLAEKYLGRLLALDEKHAKGMALLGSVLTMRARDAFWPNTRLDYLKRGLNTMDAAVKLAPDDAEVRLIRAVNNFQMPNFLNRDEIARNDFEWIWEKVQAQPEKYTNDLKQDAALHYGLVLQKNKRLEEAKQVWKKGLEIEPSSLLAGEIRRHLK